MTFQGNGPLDTSDVSAGGGGGRMGRGTMIGGGGIGAVVIGLIATYFLGFNPFSDGGTQPPPQGANAGVSQADQQLDQHLKSCTIEKANSDTACRIVATKDSLNKVWPTVLKGYKPPRGVKIMPMGAQSINTACGVASAETGPFYCPGDQMAVFQLDFMDRVLKQMGGSNAPFAQEYVVAHEWGHLVQTLLGDIKKAQQGSGAQGGSVRVELQADCYAGIWASKADKGANAMLKPLTQKEIADAIKTAQAIGDDTIQRNAGRNPNPESFSHGTSAQRVKWFNTGYKSGDIRQCNTFTGTI